MSDFIQVLTTCASQDEARQIARVLVEQRLAACVQIVGPIESVYRWQGEIETAVEWQCWAKTVAQLYAQVEQAIFENHSYKLPEVVVVPIPNGSKDYLEWLRWEVHSR